MGVKFKGKIMSNYSKEVEWQQGITTGIGFCVYSLLEYCRLLLYKGVAVSMSEFNTNGVGSLPRSGKLTCFSMFDIVNLLLKKNKRLILFSWFGVLWLSAGV